MANIELKKLKKFFDKKTTERGTLFNKRAVESETFFIGEGTLVFKNYFISLDAIAAVTLNQLQDISIKRYVIYLILCFLIFFVPFSVIKVMSVIGIIICGITIFLIWLKNKNKIYTLRIDLCNGSHYLYSHNNKEFICQVADLIRMCIDD